MAMSLKTSKPLLCQSKLLCFSLFYLFTSLFLALYTSLSNTRCILRTSPFDPIQYSLFSYPSSYGEHKYALPTHRSSCDSPVYFSDYSIVVEELEELCRNSTALGSGGTLRYVQGNAKSFGGNFSVEERFSYFDHEYDDETEIPCGFFRRAPISIQDQVLMEGCDRVVVVSAIFGDHDKIRQPRGLGAKTLDFVCFFMFVDEVTLRKLDYHNLISRKSKEYKIGVWRIVKVASLYENAAMNGVIFKYLVHRFFQRSKYSIWVDAKLQLVVDPLLLIHSLVVKEDVDMAISKHPFYVHTMEDAVATARWKKWWDVEALKTQMETYCHHGLEPWSSHKAYPSDVADTALIIRKHSVATNLFSCLVFNELEGFNPRDQLAFGFVRDRMKPKLKLNMFDLEVFEQVALEYRHNLKLGGGPLLTMGGPKLKRATFGFLNYSCTKCDRYLSEMWADSRN